MTLCVRKITLNESKVLDRWQRADHVVCYRRARIVRLSADGRKAPDIAKVLGLHVEVVRQTIKDCNQGGLPAITSRPRSGGR